MEKLKQGKRNILKQPSSEFKEVYSLMNNQKYKYGIFQKCLFHLHTPASHDYKLLNKYTDEKYYQKSTEEEIYQLCLDNGVLIESISLDTFNSELFSLYKDRKECLTYLLIAQKIFDKRISIVLITDHNTISGYLKLKKAISVLNDVKKAAIYPELILGIELTCADKNHVVGIFEETDERILQINQWVDEHIISNEDGTYLTSIEVMRQINTFGGIPYIAHADTSDMFKDGKYLSAAYKSTLFNLPFFNVVGLSDKNKQEKIRNLLGNYRNEEVCYIIDEDSHTIDSIGSKTFWIKGNKRGFSMIKAALRDYSISLEYEEPALPDSYIKALVVKQGQNGFLKGLTKDFCIAFSESLNCFIGGRGTGKSTVLQLIEFILRQKCLNEKTLEFICRHESIWMLFCHNNEEYMLYFYSPIKEYADDNILKYFSNERSHKYGVRYPFDLSQIQKHTLRNYLHLEKIHFQANSFLVEPISSKGSYLENFFNTRYSINELVQTASGEEINIFIQKLILNNRVLATPSAVLSCRSRSGLKNTLDSTKSIIDERNRQVVEIVNDFNMAQKGILRITYKQDEQRVQPLDFENLLWGNAIINEAQPYKNYNILNGSVIAYLETLNSKLGIQKMMLLLLSEDYEEVNKQVSIGEMLEEKTPQLITQGIQFVDKDQEVKLIHTIAQDIINDTTIFQIINYLKYYVTEMESFGLEFNLNSKESNRNQKELYRDVRVLSLGQKVVAMLSFVLGYSEYSGDFTPLIIDQPEDNLDNQYIYKNLVKQLRAIKLKRQVIIATHNATIVTNAKAEQVVVMESDNENGWIQDTGYPNEKPIKTHIINYLEGGVESFKHKCFIYEEITNKKNK